MKTIKLSILLLALLIIGQAKAQGLSGSGTTDDPYLISSNADWNTFAQSVTNDTTYAGQTVKLTADITATSMAGSHTSETNYHAFSGTFDGDGHTITLALSGSGEGTALFSDIKGATLKNLKAQGTVTTNKNRPATFAAFVFGNSTIRNCWSTVAVSSTKTNSWVDGGGFVARVSSNDTLNMTDCAFHGSVTYDATSYSGGSMVGFTQAGATVYLTNCLYSPTALVLTLSAYNPHVFVSGDVRGTLSNCYYNDVAKASILENEGTDASNMSNEALAAALGAGWHVYNNMVVPFTGTYYISSAAEWNAFATTVNNGTSYSGQTVALTTDIPTAITTMAGTDSHPFCGTFDGDGHSITLALSGNGPGTALFYLIEGATLKNLKVQGSVATSGYRPATFAAFVEGNCTISNCWSTVAVSSTKANDWVDGGGFVGRVSSSTTLNMTGCAFHGSVTFTFTATSGGGMVGFTQTGAVVNLTNCLYSPTALALNVSQYSPRIFVSGDEEGNLTNCYYNDVAAAATALGKQGKQMRSITGDANVTVAFDGEATTYDMSGISAYSVGLVYDSTLYAGQGDTLSLSLNLACTTPPDYVCIGFSASAGTLTGTANPYTLAMPNEDVTLQAIIESLSSVNYIDGDSVVHTCNNFTILTGDETTLEAGWYAVYDNLTYDSTLTLNGDVTLILCNGKTMTVNGSDIDGFQTSLTLYGQSLDSIVAGTLNVFSDDVENSAIDLFAGTYTQHSGNVVVSNSGGNALQASHIIMYGGSIHVSSGWDGIVAAMTINGGSINANGSNYGIYTSGSMTINGGSIHANGGDSGIYALDLTINGGKVEASSIHAENNITLGWTNTDDYILAGSYSAGGTISVKSGQAFYCEEDENVIVSGTLDEDQIDAIGGKTLRPHFVNYMDGEGEMHICTDFTVLTGDETTLDAGWYVADSDLAYDHTLTLNGDVTLILCDGKTMTVNPDSGNSIIGAWNYTLTVYGQTLDSETAGTLYVTNNVESKEAIDLSTYTQHSGNVVVSDSNDQAIHASFTLNGGTVNATSKQQCIWGNVIINGGIVNANNTGSGEAIYNDGNIIINGGTVNATATGTGGDGIYVNGNVTINGGTVNATGIYNGIHAQFDLILGWANANDHILVSSYEASEGTVSVKSGQAFYYIDDYSGEPVIISGTLDEEQIEAIGGKTLFPYAPVAYIDENGVEQYCISYTVVTDNLNFGDLPDGWYVVSDSITINNRNVTSDNAHLILCDGASMNISDGTGAALWVSDSLTLYGQSEGTGSLTAISNNNYGIIASNMTVNGGTVTATSTSYGIFADHNLTINGGTVNATGNDSGIYNGDASGYVTINGGTVTTNKIFSPTVTLGWSDTNDSITVGSFAYSGTPTVSVKSGQAFCYIGESGETVVISGTLNEAQIEAIGGKTLRPYVIARTVAGFGQGNGGWVLIASPFSETNPLNVTGMLSGSHDLYAFVPNPSDDLEWRNYATDTFNLEAGKGYLYANADTVTLTFNGTHIAATEPVEVPLTYDADDDRRCWNLVGNPFPFAAYLDREYYVLDADGTGIDPEPIPATTPVPPCTAVFVKAVGVNDRAVFSVTAP